MNLGKTFSVGFKFLKNNFAEFYFSLVHEFSFSHLLINYLFCWVFKVKVKTCTFFSLLGMKLLFVVPKISWGKTSTQGHPAELFPWLTSV